MAFEGLPEELTTLILAKLPVKSLLRCKCVRKSWYSLIKSPYFIRLHHRSSSSSSPQFIFSRCDQEEEKEPRYFLSFYSYETLADLGNEITIPFSYPLNYHNRLNYHGELGEVSLSAPCDGLVCLTNHNDQTFICNPAMRELRSLFVPHRKRSGYHIESVAFGTDPKTGGYKVVMIGVPYDYCAFCDSDISADQLIDYTREEDYTFVDHEAYVYDFNTDSWRETSAVIPGPFLHSHHAVSLNGSFHWCPPSIPERGDLSDILTFHISDEVTESIPMPDCVDRSRCLLMKLCVSRKSELSLLVSEGERFEICVMTEYGVKESWTKLFQFGPLMDIWEPVTFWGDQRLLLLTTNSSPQLVSWDPQHPHHLRYFPIFGGYEMYPYSESLVSVNVLQ